jgi:hypothetical protein
MKSSREGLGHRRGKMTEKFKKKVQNEELHNLYSLSKIVLEIIKRNIHITCTRKREIHDQFFVGNPKQNRSQETEL